MRSSFVRVTAVVAVTLLSLVLTGVQGQGGYCGDGAAVNKTYFDDLVSVLKGTSNQIERQQILTDSTNGTSLGFSSAQIVDLLSLFDNNIAKTEILASLSPLILGLMAQDVKTILLTVDNELLRLKMLPALVNLTVDIKQNNATVLSVFANTFNKRDALNIIAGAAGRSCVWGDVNYVTRLVFVIDVSTSMGETFVDQATGKTTSRIQFVKQQIDMVMSLSLASWQQFNVISFSDSARAWQPGVVPVTYDNVQSAVSFVAMLTAQGSTNMLGALKLAFSDPNAQGVYLLSDGEPDPGQNPLILSAAQAWSKTGENGPLPLNTICFQPGGQYNPAAGQFMSSLASLTGGIYRLTK